MSSLPEINQQIVSQKLLAKVSELTYQSVQLEVLAEALRDERDQARQELETLRQAISEDGDGLEQHGEHLAV